MQLDPISQAFADLCSLRIDQITLATFVACNGVRIVAYLPQIRKAAIDQNGASAISYTTWTMFLIANLSTIAYAIINRADLQLAICFTGNAVCCIAILAVAYCKRRKYRRRHHEMARFA